MAVYELDKGADVKRQANPLLGEVFVSKKNPDLTYDQYLGNDGGTYADNVGVSSMESRSTPAAATPGESAKQHVIR